MKTSGKVPEIVMRNGKPSAVILDIDEYREMLERLEDIADLQTLHKMRKTNLKFTKLQDFISER